MSDVVQKADLSRLLNDIRSELHIYEYRYGVKIRTITMEWERDKTGGYSIVKMHTQNHD